MDTLQLLMGGFATVLQPENLFFTFLGCFLGTLIGVLPGIGPSAGTAMLIPVAAVLSPTQAIIMLAGIYYGTMYGGTITSVLVNVPGEAASAITCIDGHAMAKKGRAGPALAIAAIGSFIGGTIATIGLVLVAVPLAQYALKFGPPEFFCLMIVGLSLVTGLAGRSLVRALLSAVIGLLIAMVGIDPVMGAPRFTFDKVELLDGLGIVPVLMGLFGIGEILVNAERRAGPIINTSLRSLLPNREEAKQSIGPIVRGTGVGFFLGLIPGVGAVVPTFISYILERKVSKHPETFGEGAIAGVAGPETANNAYANAALVPLFAVGIPGSPTIAILMSAFMIHGVIPGPFMFQEHATVVWAVVASLYVGSVILLILNLPMIPLWVAILKIPYSILFALILAFCVVGAYSLNSSTFDIGVMLAFGVIGYCFKKLDIPLAPLALTLILGPLMERGLRQSLEMSQGDFMIFLTRPISATLLAIAAVFVALACLNVAKSVKEDSEV